MKPSIFFILLLFSISIAAVSADEPSPYPSTLALPAVQNSSVTGLWKTIDDETGKPKSYVEIYQGRDGLYYGKITELLNRAPSEDQDPYCKVCPKDDPRHNQRIIGMNIIQKMEKNGSTYSGGTILDPKSGKIYTCKFWLDDGELKVRGYVGPFFRTQTWKRVR